MPRITAAQFRAMKQKREKYHRSPASERTCAGVVYDSKAEMVYHQMNPDALYKPGSLDLPGSVRYEPDFWHDDVRHYVDVKGMRTAAYNIKMRLYASLPSGPPIHEVKAVYRRGRIVDFRTVRIIVPGKPVPRATKKRRKA